MLFLVFERFIPLITLMWIILTLFVYWVDGLLGSSGSKYHGLMESLFAITFVSSLVSVVVYVAWQLSWWVVTHPF